MEKDTVSDVGIIKKKLQKKPSMRTRSVISELWNRANLSKLWKNMFRDN